MITGIGAVQDSRGSGQFGHDCRGRWPSMTHKHGVVKHTSKMLTGKHMESKMEGLLARNEPNIWLATKGAFMCLFIIHTVHNQGREGVLCF